MGSQSSPDWISVRKQSVLWRLKTLKIYFPKWCNDVFVMWPADYWTWIFFFFSAIWNSFKISSEKQQFAVLNLPDFVFCFLSAHVKGVTFFALMCVFALWLSQQCWWSVCVCVHGQIHQRGKLVELQRKHCLCSVCGRVITLSCYLPRGRLCGELWFPNSALL